MIEYLVEQQLINGDQSIRVYRGYDQQNALDSYDESVEDLNKCIIGDRWQTVMVQREVSPWTLVKGTP